MLQCVPHVPCVEPEGHKHDADSVAQRLFGGLLTTNAWRLSGFLKLTAEDDQYACMPSISG